MPSLPQVLIPGACPPWTLIFVLDSASWGLPSATSPCGGVGWIIYTMVILIFNFKWFLNCNFNSLFPVLQEKHYTQDLCDSLRPWGTKNTGVSPYLGQKDKTADVPVVTWNGLGGAVQSKRWQTVDRLGECKYRPTLPSWGKPPDFSRVGGMEDWTALCRY